MKYKISEAVNHTLEWRRGGKTIKQEVRPTLRAVDYKVPKLVWYVEDDGCEGGRP